MNKMQFLLMLNFMRFGTPLPTKKQIEERKNLLKEKRKKEPQLCSIENCNNK